MQSIEIDTTDVVKITDIAKNVDSIVNQGVLFQFRFQFQKMQNQVVYTAV
jgi:hypothetical protein